MIVLTDADLLRSLIESAVLFYNEDGSGSFASYLTDYLLGHGVSVSHLQDF